MGSFSEASKLIKSEIRYLLNNSLKNSHIFGICLGMQLLLQRLENGENQGLDYIKGQVELIKDNKQKLFFQ